MPVENLSDSLKIIGNYDLLTKIAEGGMGTVYRGRHRVTGETVAVKVVPQHLLSNPIVLKRFEQEYNVARLIDHPNIVKALDFGREGDTRFLVMEYVEGESLGQKLERDGRLPEAEAIEIILQIARGLQFAHKQGMVHRDVKPDNILITEDGHAKLTDLGLVKEIETDLNLTRTGRGLGTPHFMSPEQFRNAKNADARCDIYSLGATLYMMVTGELPFQSNGPLDAWMKKVNNEIIPPRQLVNALSERIDWAIRRAISADPIHRPESCREFIEDLTGHSTRNLSGTATTADVLSDQWYMVYTDEADNEHTVRGTTKGIRKSFNDGLLGDASGIRVARSKAGPFEPMRNYPEFRDLAIKLEKLPPAAPTQKKSDAEAKKPSIPAPPKRKESPSNDLSESMILATTVILPSATKSRSKSNSGPMVNFNAPSSTLVPDLWRWFAIACLFGLAGLAATNLNAILRLVRSIFG